MRRVVAIAVLLALVAASCTDDTPNEDAEDADVYEGPPVSAPAHPLGLKYDLNRSDTFAPFLRRLAGGTTFFMLVWCDVEREQGQRDWTEPDRAVALAQRLGYRMALHVRVGSCWATGGRVGEERGRRAVTPSAPPRDVETYRSFVRAVVERYRTKGVHDYAIENEVNAAAFWRGTADEYSDLVAAAAPVIREADSEARVFDSGLSSTAYGAGIADDLRSRGQVDEAITAYNRYYTHRASTRARDFPVVQSDADLESALIEGQGQRNLTFLRATEELVRTGTVQALQLHFYEDPDAIPDLLEYVRRHTPERTAVEVWELGMYRAGQRQDDRTQADQLATAVASLLAGGIGRIVYLPAAYDPGGRRESEVRWGLLRPDGTAGPAAELYSSLARAASGATVEPVRARGLSGVVLARGGETTLVLWSEPGARLGARPAGATAADATGDPVPWGDVGSAPLVLKVPGDVSVARQVLAAASSRS